MASTESLAMLPDFLHMNSGNENSSYAKNSSPQEYVINKAQSVLKETIKSIANGDGFPQCFNIADLGCSTGPNTLIAISNIIIQVHEVCQENDLKPPQFQVCLNDLYGNDFNSIFKSLPDFYAKHNKDNGEKSARGCFVLAVPGSFHGRLFPDKSMHFFHSSTSLHWLSQVPEGLENNGLNIHIAETSPPDVFEKYRMQFQKDFTTFLGSRSNEIMDGGRMVLTIPGRSNVDPACCTEDIDLHDLLAKSLVDIANEGLVKESEIISFNIPMYAPFKDEIRDLIHNQGSFSVDILESFEVNWDPYAVNIDESNHGKTVAKVTRAGYEPLLVTYFGNSVMDLLFQNFEEYLDKYMSADKTMNYSNIVISLTKI